MAGFVAGLVVMWSLGASRLPLIAHRSQATTHGEWVFLREPSGDSLRAYVAYPERKDPAPAVIVIHEIFGLTDWEPTIVDRLAGAGYVAIVPDLLSPRFGMTPADPDSGRKLTALLDADAVNADLDMAYAYLNSLPSVRKDQIGSIGFCWAANFSLPPQPEAQGGRGLYGPARLPDPASGQNTGVYAEDDARSTPCRRSAGDRSKPG
jgi:carboxymethylenebutenolidase